MFYVRAQCAPNLLACVDRVDCICSASQAPGWDGRPLQQLSSRATSQMRVTVLVFILISCAHVVRLEGLSR